jgi:hypothetical protein
MMVETAYFNRVGGDVNGKGKRMDADKEDRC